MISRVGVTYHNKAKKKEFSDRVVHKIDETKGELPLKRMLKVWSRGLFLLFCYGLLAACSNQEVSNESEKEEPPQTAEPVTLIWAHQWGEDHLKETVVQFIAEEFPHVTIEFQDAGTDHPDSLEELVAANKVPDIVTMGRVSHMSALNRYELSYDMSELIEQSDYDLDHIEPSIIEYLRNEDGSLYALPESRPTWALHYNKDVFDMLGVDYPEDEMTWMK